MDSSKMLTIFEKEVRRECEWTRMHREALPNLVRYTLTEVGEGGGYISWSDLTADTAETAIQNQIDYFRGLNLDFEWKYYSYDQPADLPERLLAHGFTAEEPEALMVADIEDLPAEYWTLDVSAVRRISTPQELDEMARMQSEIWGEEITGLAEGMQYDLEHNPDSLSVYAVWQDGRMVSAAWTNYLLSTSFATLWGGSTLKQYRNRGFYTSLLAARAREARQRGFRFLQVDASTNSQPILAKHGFNCLAYSTPYKWKPN
jgi:GNAT superfamily N-acetyltransferase